MKKIIATVLAMVMALALCSTAFAATEVKAEAIMKTNDAKLYYSVTGDVANKITLTYTPAKAATLNSDGEQTNTANVAYYTLTSFTSTSGAVVTSGKYVVVASKAEADLVVYNNCTKTGDASNVLMYLAETKGEYKGTGTVFTNFGAKCGQVNVDIEKDKTYYTSNEKGNNTIYVTATADATEALMVGGKLVNVKAFTVTSNVVPHVAVPTYDKETSKVVGYTCVNCKLAAIEAPNYASIPANNSGIITGNWYFPAVAASTTTTTTSSPKTFDAGIAMYVGMALTSVAGSAVVIGKKKEF